MNKTKFNCHHAHEGVEMRSKYSTSLHKYVDCTYAVITGLNLGQLLRWEIDDDDVGRRRSL